MIDPQTEIAELLRFIREAAKTGDTQAITWLWKKRIAIEPGSAEEQTTDLQRATAPSRRRHRKRRRPKNSTTTETSE